MTDDIPEWSTPDGPWCLKQWLPYSVPDPKIDCCLRPLDHEGLCKGIHGQEFQQGKGMVVGQLENVSREEATRQRFELQEKKIQRVADLARELGADVNIVTGSKNFVLTAVLKTDYLERVDA